MTTALLAAIGAATGYALAAVLQALAVRRYGAGAVALARSPLYLLALAGDGAAWLLSLLALRRLPLFTVQSILAGSLALTVVLAHALLGTRLRRVDTVAVVVMVLALAAVGGAGHEQHATGLGTRDAWGVIAAVAALVLTYALGSLLQRRPGGAALPGWAYGVLAGLAFSAAAVCARGLPPSEGWPQVLTQPLAWGVVVSGVLGIRAYAAAMHHGDASRATALLWGVEVVASALVGVLLLGDSVRAGWALPATLGVAGVLAAAVVLALSPGERAAEQGRPLPPPP